jgi:hypothetical protein
MRQGTDAYTTVQIANEAENLVKNQFSPLVCQCCGHTKKVDTDPECVCAGLEWYLDKDGRVECQAHRFARAVGGNKRSFIDMVLRR